MSNDKFQARLERLNSETQQMPHPQVQPNQREPFDWNGAIKGFGLSIVIGFAFANMQAISDMAPQSIKEGPMPGLFGLPVALVSVAWVVITPIWFLRTAVRPALSGWKETPAGFPVGLFAGLALTLFMSKALL